MEGGGADDAEDWVFGAGEVDFYLWAGGDGTWDVA